MKLKDLLLEGRGQNISLEESLNFIKKNKYNSKCQPIYRGMIKTIDFYYIDPKQSFRKPVNISNYYSLYMDNSPEWKEFPKRSQSIICTNDEVTAESFGNAYYVIPEYNAKFGICPNSDIWDSFGKTWKNGLIDYLCDAIDYIRSFIENDNLKSFRGTYAEMLELFKKIDNNKHILEYMALHKRDCANFNYLYNDWIWGMHGCPFIEYVKSILSPEKNDFKIEHYNENFSVPINTSREIWTDSICLLIRESKFDELVNKKLI